MYPTLSLVNPTFKRFPILFPTGSKKMGFLVVSQEVHIPTQSAHPIQLNPPTKSDPKRPPIPTESAHLRVAFLKGEIRM
jgi:hypothetical protein